MNLTSLRISMLASIYIVVSAQPSYAYLDPGTASIALQALIGGIAAGLATVGMYWTRIKAFFYSRTRKGQ